jgi:hypothetical protein
MNETIQATQHKQYKTQYIQVHTVNTSERDQQDAHFFLKMYFTYIILDVFRTYNFSSSSGVLYKQLTVSYHASL